MSTKQKRSEVSPYKDKLQDEIKRAIKDGKHAENISNQLLKRIEMDNIQDAQTHSGQYSYLYPNLVDPQFNIKIANKREFYDSRYEEQMKPVKEASEAACHSEFELSQHQIFVRNFLSFLTPYNGLLLFHGLGTGKTCSAISACEEMRAYMKQMGLTKKIIIIAAPKVQANFKLQLFDETKLQEVDDGIWNLRACTGNTFLKEINPMHMKGFTRKNIIKLVRTIIRQYYTFAGYIQFSNLIEKIRTKYKSIKNRSERNAKFHKALKQEFSNRFIVIDEVHNIRNTTDNPTKKIIKNLTDIARYSNNLKLLLLSATPMFNSYREIIDIINLLNINDGRYTIALKDVFDKHGNFKINKKGEQIGLETFKQKIQGYVSFVQGENPYSFPHKIYPRTFDPEHSYSVSDRKHTLQLNESDIIVPQEFTDCYMTTVGSYQQRGYEYAIRPLQKKFVNHDKIKMGIGWVKIDPPLQTLNIVYPSKTFDSLKPDSVRQFDIRTLIGKKGLNRIMTHSSNKKNYAYSKQTMANYGAVFSQQEIGKYSGKIATLTKKILESTGIILVYSQYIDGGSVPIALALEQLGITRYGRTHNLFKEAPVEKIDYTMKSRKDVADFNPAKYIMITGDASLSPNDATEIAAATSKKNKHGKQVKVILITKAGSEGLDFQNIRQVHILDPWYNNNRTEQTIGRASRFCSHKELALTNRNVEIYMYGTRAIHGLEPIDMYLYRLAEQKSIQIGKITRVLKETAVDCLLNKNISNLTEQRMNQQLSLKVSSGKTILYAVGNKGGSSVCDFMEDCSFKCIPDVEDDEYGDNIESYNQRFIVLNVDRLMQKIKTLFKERYIYTKNEIIRYIQSTNSYPIIQINSALNQLITDPNEYIYDMFGRVGKLTNSEHYYMFQPSEYGETRITHFDRFYPIDHKRGVIKYDVSHPLDTYTTMHSESALPITSKSNIKTILQTIESNFNNSDPVHKTEHKARSVNDYYENSREVVQLLSELDFNGDTIPVDILRDFVVQHNINTLSPADTKTLIEYLLSTTKLTPRETKIQTYLFATTRFEKDGVVRFFLPDIKGFKIYKVSKQTLVVASPIEQQKLQKTTEPAAFLRNKSSYHQIIGFMAKVNRRDITAFKVKNFKNTRNSSFTCKQSIKTKILALLDDIVSKTILTKIKERKLSKYQICICLELIMRYYQSKNKDDKLWFLTQQEVFMNNIRT